MAYIIENANILKNKGLTTSSLLIDGDRIAGIRSRFNRYRLIKMNLEPFIMNPSYVMLNSVIPANGSFQEMKKSMIEQVLIKGCTTLITYAAVSFEEELEGKISEMATALISSPIDFIIGIKIPTRLITPSFIRKCKKEKIPAIFVELSSQEEMTKVPWGWIRDALFPYNCPLIPIISTDKKKEAKPLLSKWKDITMKEKIPAIYEEVAENQPLSVPVLNKIGVYPKKASLMIGSELSYNLYRKSREIMNVDELELFHYHGDRLVLTIHKGKIVRSGAEVLFKPGFGEHVKVLTPSYFSL
ncbi:hypothetical protein [Bacillus sp. FJAT-29814]|uniref:hypothetical protein n=1 Tax=Bacillus sp. FJAT-29814 TaxID=1729688 RepID=UPI00082F409E|nr:hypothetical protein [Bacillus sp. FJAT-29814]